MKFLSPFLFTLSLSSFAVAAPLQIAGVAKDATANKPLADRVVQLVRPGDGGKKTLLATARTDAAGKFQFPSREYGKDELLMANIPHQGFDYWAVAYDGGNKLKSVNINVNPRKVEVVTFDSTDQPNAAPLVFQVHHLAVKSTPNGLHCIERIVVENPSKFTYTGFGERKISVLLNVPKVATNLKLDTTEGGAKLLKTKDGWGIARPITPVAYGARNALIFSYDVPWPSKLPWAKKVDLGRELGYPTKFFFVARESEDKDLSVLSTKLSADTSQELPIDGKTEVRLVNSVGAPMGGTPPIPAGQKMDVAISRPVNPLFWGFAAMVGALCVFLPLALVKPRGRAKSVERPQTENVNVQSLARDGVAGASNLDFGSFGPLNGLGTELAASPDARALIQKIADLDDLFEAGKMDEASYQSQRSTWKKQLIEALATSHN